MSSSIVPPTAWHAEQWAKLAAADPRYAKLLGIVSPPPVRSLPCVHEGPILHPCPAGRDNLHVRECREEHGRTTRERCRSCEDYDAGPVFEVRHSGMGIGDAVAGVYAACGLADATGRNVVYHARNAGWMTGVSHPRLSVVHADHSAAKNMNEDYDGQLRACAAGTVPSVHQWYCDQLARQFGIANFAPVRPQSVAKPAPVIEPGYVVLSPFSQHHSREWPADKWRDLANLLHASGRRVVGLDGPGTDAKLKTVFGPTPAVWHWGNSPEWTAGLIAHADAFAGNDSGMAHVAGLYGTPSVAVHSHLLGFVFRDTTPTVTSVGADGWGCQGCGWRRPCPTGGACGALASIPVEKVLLSLGTPAPKTSLDVFDTIRRHLGKRAKTTEWLFREIQSRWADPRIVETGCVRQEWDWGAGYFGWLAGSLLERHGGGHLASVDNDPGHCRTARRLCAQWTRITVVDSDSVGYLRDRTKPIDVAYLDSHDADLPGHAEHGLAEAQAVEPLMSERGLIVFDDTPPDMKGGWAGKGRLAVPWLQSRGWMVRPESGYQAVLERVSTG